MAVLKATVTAILRSPYFGLGFSKCRNLHMPCKSTEKKTVSWSSSNLSVNKKSITENITLVSLNNGNHLLEKDVNKPLKFYCSLKRFWKNKVSILTVLVVMLKRRKFLKDIPANAKVQKKEQVQKYWPQVILTVVILQWLMAKHKHVWKFIEIYLNHGFDVLPVKLKTGQLIWPTMGSQAVAKDLLKTLSESHSNRTIVIHGFSVGGYLWGEVLLKMAEDMERYQPLIKNIAGAIWDSVVDIHETAVGVPAAVFPNNTLLRNACRRYILYHMKAFEKESTRHWRNSREMFFRPVVKCPSLLLYSKSDPIGNINSYKNLRMSYESLGIQTYEKCWERSPHVAHYAFHKEEYLNQMEMFLEKIGVLDALGQKRAAAL